MTTPQINLLDAFNNQAKPQSRNGIRTDGSDYTSISVRVTLAERAMIKQMAGTVAVSNFIRQRLFGDDVDYRPTKYLRKKREPKLVHVEIARLLGMFGNSELAQSLIALSIVAERGELDVTDEIEDSIQAACEDIETIKIALMLALGIKPQEASAR